MRGGLFEGASAAGVHPVWSALLMWHCCNLAGGEDSMHCMARVVSGLSGEECYPGGDC